MQSTWEGRKRKRKEKDKAAQMMPLGVHQVVMPRGMVYMNEAVVARQYIVRHVPVPQATTFGGNRLKCDPRSNHRWGLCSTV